jgi:hypothetical protein
MIADTASKGSILLFEVALSETIVITVVTKSAAVYCLQRNPRNGCSQSLPRNDRLFPTSLREQCLPSRWLPIDVCFNFDISSFSRHVTIFFTIINELTYNLQYKLNRIYATK